VGLHGPPRPVLHRAHEVHVVKDTLRVPLHVPGWALHGARAGFVDEVRNCEDILMNFVVAEEAEVGSVLVGAKRVRDYGDARNEEESEEKGVSVVGLSSRKGEHRKRRGWCIREFHRVLGRMPLRYSYRKVVDFGEQGLCFKGVKLVYCDQCDMEEMCNYYLILFVIFT